MAAVIAAAVAVAAAAGVPPGARRWAHPRLALAAAVAPANPGANASLPGGLAAYAAGCTTTVHVPSLAAPVVAAAVAPSGGGYWIVGADGGVFSFGTADFAGSMGGTRLAAPIVAVATTPDGSGYWLVAADGGVFSFGDAAYHGSVAGLPVGERPASPVVAIVPSRDGGGYLEVTSTGGVYAFGDAAFRGSEAGLSLAAPVVAAAATPSGLGYWLVAADGGVFSFGDAAYHGSVAAFGAAERPASPVVAIVPSRDGGGYLEVTSTGGVYAFGDAPFFGSAAGIRLVAPIVAASATPTGGGYRLVAADGGVFGFGAATFRGSVPGALLAESAPSSCDRSWLAAIDAARAAEGVGPMVLPANWDFLTPAQQVFVALDLERTARGMAPLAGMTDIAAAEVDWAAGVGGDPQLLASYGGLSVGLQSGIWWGSSAPTSVLEAVWAWMYDDGVGGINAQCTPTDPSACWGHRDAILGAYTPGSASTAVIDVAYRAPAAPSGWAVSVAASFIDVVGAQPTLTLTWSAEAPFLRPGA